MIGRSMGISRTMKNIGSQATNTAANKAGDVALGAMNARSTIHPGSSAGLKNSKIVRLHPNGSGYHDPANQTARYAKKEAPQMPAMKTQLPQAVSHHTFDSRLTSSSTSSISRLSRLKK